MKTVIWVTGKLGVGKTSIIKEKVDNCVDAVASALYVGQMCRARFGAAHMAKDANPSAPEETERYVREMVCHHIDNIPDGGVLFIDGVPRKPSQVRWIRENFYSHYNIDSSVLYVTCDEEVRRERVKKRDGSNPDDWALTMARMEKEDKTMLRVLEELCFLDMTPRIIDNSPGISKYSSKSGRDHLKDCVDTDDIESVHYVPENLEIMFELHAQMNDVALAKQGLDTHKLYSESSKVNELSGVHISVQWARRYANKAIEELHELLRELPDTWWSDDVADIRKARVELIDSWHFLMSLSFSLGMDARAFSKAYYDKRLVNLNRWENGYKKRDKGETRDDLHIGRV